MDNLAARDVVLFGLLIHSVSTDLRRGIISNRLVVLGLISGLLFHVVYPDRILETILSALWLAATALAIRYLGKTFFNHYGMGMGDVKLGLVIGLWAGIKAFAVLYIAILGAGIVSITLRWSGDRQERHTLPFAPFLLFGFCVDVLVLRLLQW